MTLIFIYVYYFMVICAVGRSAAKRHHRMGNDSAEVLVVPDTMLDLTGSLRQRLFVASALTQPLKNSICSPISAMMPLGKLALGAVGDSLNELLLALGLSKKNKIKRHFKRLIAEMRYLPDVKLSVASRLYVAKTVSLKSSFLDDTKEVFQATTERVDFKNPQSTARAISRWVEKQTDNKIKDIVTASDIDPASVLVIVNAIHFTGKWIVPFEHDKETLFHSTKGKKYIRMMKQTSLYYYSNSGSLNAELLRIPYVGEKYYFLIVLPNPESSIAKLLRLLKRSPDILDFALMRMNMSMIKLHMPIFKIESSHNLKRLYKEVGVQRIFQRESGLDEMVRNTTVHVSAAKQKAFIEVDVAGTEAGAASIITVMKMSFTKPKELLVNRPFLFFIILQNQQIFSGVFNEPT